MDALREWMESDLDVIMIGTFRGKLKKTACPEVFGMSNMRKCANCCVYHDFSLYPKQFVRARTR